VSAPDTGRDRHAIGANRSGDAAANGVRSIDTRELMAGERAIVIRHGNEEYRLQITSAGKLLLTK
jgi:hemin uptake protein HemP